MLAEIWSDNQWSEVFFLIAAIIFALEFIMYVARRADPNFGVPAGLMTTLGLLCISFGLLAL